MAPKKEPAHSKKPQRTAVVAILGAPNAGKSTLLNTLIDHRVAIVSDKVQTTRRPVRGIAVEGEAQLVFIDTPGLFAAQRRMEKAMVRAAWGAIEGADIVLLLVDAADKYSLSKAEAILQQMPLEIENLWLAVNKIDSVNPEKALPIIAGLHEKAKFAETFIISASTRDGTRDLMKALLKAAPEGPWLYDGDQAADLSSRALATEFTREQLFRQLGQELPYATNVATEAWENFDNGSVRIQQIITVERDGQKAIVIGKGGTRLKEIGEKARAAIAESLGCPVHLVLRVRVREGWQNEADTYLDLGLEG